ncbi:cysteine desulfurase [Candidatus Peregrinibacteria bacterium]|jgi:cysteine desulfurase|nr:cysteine desulfurase [Candidatus Peregrinibacteria bacterium]
MIYLDHAATTPLRKEVMEAMLPFFEENFGNPNSVHQIGQKARASVDQARVTIANILHRSPHEIIFTSGGTESNNLAIKGILQSFTSGHVIVSAIEHPSVNESLSCFCHKKEKTNSHSNLSEISPNMDPRLRGDDRKGGESKREKENDRGRENLEGKLELTYINPEKNGIIDPKKIKDAIREDTRLICFMYANNEIGTIQAITKIGRIAEKAEIPFHCDAVQAGSLDLDINKLKVTSLSLSGHKIYGPKGIGMLYVKKGLKLIPQIEGGGQEHRRRSGTENVASIVGFAKALELIQQEREKKGNQMRELRDFFIDSILSKIPDCFLNGEKENRLSNNINILFKNVSAESLLLRLDMAGICVSTGSACSSGSLEASDTLFHIGLTKEESMSSLRFSLGRMNTKKEIDEVIQLLKKIISDLRSI